MSQILTGFRPTKLTREALEAKKAELEKTVPVIDEAIRMIDLRMKSFQSSSDFIREVSTHQAKCAKSLKLGVDDTEVAENTPPLKNSASTTSHAGTVFSDLHLSQMEGNATTDYLIACRGHEVARLEWEQEHVSKAQGGISGILSEAQQLLAEWQDQKKRTECGIRAADRLLVLIEGTSLTPIGAFAVLRQAVFNEVEEPYLRLWSDITEAEMVVDLQTGLEG